MTVYASPEPGDGGPTPVYAVKSKALAGLVMSGDFDPSRDAFEELDPRLDLMDRSPSGFAWGYRGSGPRQLALAILAHACSEDTAMREHQRFKEEVIAKQDDDEPLLVTEGDIKRAVGGARP